MVIYSAGAPADGRLPRTVLDTGLDEPVIRKLLATQWTRWGLPAPAAPTPTRGADSAPRRAPAADPAPGPSGPPAGRAAATPIARTKAALPARAKPTPAKTAKSTPFVPRTFTQSALAAASPTKAFNFSSTA